METILRTGRSLVNVNTRGGFFNWSYAGRPVMPLVEGSGRQTHACWPVFGVPAHPVPGATVKMGRHGFYRTSELSPMTQDASSISLRLGRTFGERKDELYAQYPFDFITRLHLTLEGEKTLHFRFLHKNLSMTPVTVDLALHSYFPYEEEGVTLLDLQGKAYRSKEAQTTVLRDACLRGPLIDRDWDFAVGNRPGPWRLRYNDGKIISLNTGRSNRPVSHNQVWTEPAQGKFLVFEPVSPANVLKHGETAILDVLIRLENS
jgi:galactose mutarotase-like enzyme